MCRIFPEDSLPPLNSSLDIVSIKGRAVAPKDKKASQDEKPVVIHAANKHKRPLGSAEDVTASVGIKIFEENIEDRPMSKKRRNSLIPMKNSTTIGSSAILSDKANTLSGGDNREDNTLKKQLAGLEKKPMTRATAKLTRMSIVGSSNRTAAAENTPAESVHDDNLVVSTQHTVRTTRRNSMAVSGSRRLVGRDL